MNSFFPGWTHWLTDSLATPADVVCTGEQEGNGMADILFGAVVPSGKVRQSTTVVTSELPTQRDKSVPMAAVCHPSYLTLRSDLMPVCVRT